ncbi:MAG: adenylate kinase [Bdellovibrionaceae bacterium]|nr:adenylate kinase [Pseudobdellovibrionaceae bacterium]|tara:strand:+ start:43630 stop:44271 length:642 start_codon:yes stop_codon:yes gene_type:complete
MNLILFGAPGVGKGTQSALLVEKLDMRHISTGDLFRNAIKNETELGKKAKEFMDAGNLVPDEVTIGLVEEVLKNLNGQSFILDGFPRTTAQADALDGLLEKIGAPLDRVISFQVPESELVSRLTGRRVCKGCGAVYHIASKPPQQDGVCDVCGKAEVVQRKDDQEDVIKVRLENYENSTRPVKEFYQNKGQFTEIDGTGSADEVFERVQKVLG